MISCDKVVRLAPQEHGDMLRSLTTVLPPVYGSEILSIPTVILSGTKFFTVILSERSESKDL